MIQVIYTVITVALIFVLVRVIYNGGYQYGRYEVYSRLPREIQKWVDETYHKEDPNLLLRQFGEDEEAWLR